MRLMNSISCCGSSRQVFPLVILDSRKPNLNSSIRLTAISAGPTLSWPPDLKFYNTDKVYSFPNHKDLISVNQFVPLIPRTSSSSN